jgi:hypothetical protein
MSTRSGLMVAAAAATSLVAGCATRATSIAARWVNPELVGKSAVTSVLVVSAVRDSTNRRLFEDLGQSRRWRSEQIRSAMSRRPAGDQKSSCMSAYVNAELTLSTHFRQSAL